MDEINISKGHSGMYPENNPYGGNQNRGNPNRGNYGPPRRKPKKRLAFKIVVGIVIAALIAASAYAIHFINKLHYDEKGIKDNLYVNENDLAHNKNVMNILLLGVDRRSSDEASRSDTMLLVSIDKVHKKIKLTSFMRDSYVDIPEKGYYKLNAASTYGGAQLVMDTIEYNFNINIDNYVLVDFNMFQKIIDKLGGVDVEVTENEAKYMRNIVHLHEVKAGPSVHLNGKEALWYCRIRKLDSDFYRTKRQRKVMEAVIAKAKKADISDLTSILDEILPLVETNMNKSQVAKLAAGSAIIYRNYPVEQFRIPAEGTYKNSIKKGQDVLELDIGKNRDMLYNFIYNDSNETTTSASKQ